MSKWFSNMLPAIQGLTKDSVNTIIGAGDALSDPRKIVKKEIDAAKGIPGMVKQTANDIGAIPSYIKSTATTDTRANKDIDKLQKTQAWKKMTPQEKSDAMNAAYQKYSGRTPEQDASAARGGAFLTGLVAPFPGGAEGDAIRTLGSEGLSKVAKGDLTPGLTTKVVSHDGTSAMGSYIRDESGNLVKNPNPIAPKYSIGGDTPGTGFTPEEIAAKRNDPLIPQEDSLPVIDTGVTNPSATLKKSNLLTRVGNNITSDVSKTVSPDAVKNPYGPEYTQAMHDALLRNKVDHYNQAPGAARNLYDNIINPELKTNPKSLPMDAVVNGYDSTGGAHVTGIVEQMRTLDPSLDPLEAKNAASNVIDTMYDIARNTGGKENISDASLLQYKEKLGDSIAVKNYYNGIPPRTAEETAQVAGYQTLADMVANLHPNVAQATRDYGLIKDAMPSLKSAADKGRGIGVRVGPYNVGIPSAVGGPVRDVTGGALRVAGDNGKTLGGIALGATLVGSATLVPKLKDAYNNNSKGDAYGPDGGGANGKINPTTHDTSITQGVNSDGSFSVSNIPQNRANVKLNSRGEIYLPSPSQIKDTSGTTIGMDDNSFNKQYNSLKKEQARLKKLASDKTVVSFVHQKYQDQYDAVTDQLDSLNNQHALSAPLNSSYEKITDVSGNVNSLIDDLNTTSPNAAQLNGAIDDLRSRLTGPYAGFAQNLQALQQQMKGGLDAKTKSALLAQLKAVNQQLGYSYYNAVRTFVGNSVAPAGAGSQTGVGNTTGVLPPITSQGGQAVSQTDDQVPTGWATGGPSSVSLRGAMKDVPPTQ